MHTHNCLVMGPVSVRMTLSHYDDVAVCINFHMLYIPYYYYSYHRCPIHCP